MNDKKIHILVVDDETDVAEVIKTRLEIHGFHVGLAFNGQEGLHYIRTHPIDLLILDIMMPVMDGTEMADILRNDPKTAKIPIIFLSAILEKQEDMSGSRGPNIVLPKPFDADVLLEKIKILLQH